MRATDIIRGLLDLIDQVDCSEQPASEIAIVPDPDNEFPPTGEDTRFKHIFAMLSAERTSPVTYDNAPNETIANIDAVTKDASGGLNGPKHPADIRADSVSMYPNFQAK